MSPLSVVLLVELHDLRGEGLDDLLALQLLRLGEQSRSGRRVRLPRCAADEDSLRDLAARQLV